MKVVHQRLSRAAADAAFSPQQRPPARLDHPVDLPIRMRLAQRRHRRKRVQNVTHGAQPDHKQAKVGLRLQTLIFSQRRMGQAGARNRLPWPAALQSILAD